MFSVLKDSPLLDRPSMLEAMSASASSAAPNSNAVFTPRLLSPLDLARRLLGLYGVLALLAFQSVRLSYLNTGFAPIWLDDGMIVGAILCSHRAYRVPIFAVSGLAILTALLAHTPNLGRALTLTFSDLLEAGLISWGLLRWAPRVSSLRDLGILTLTGTVAAVLSCPAAVHYLNRHDHLPPLMALLTWMTAHTLGLAVSVPMTLEAMGHSILGRRTTPSPWVPCLLFGFLIAVLTGVFGQTRYPFLFMVFPPLLLLTMYLGRGVGLLAVLLIGAIAIVCTSHNLGPFALRIDLSRTERIMSIQTFLIVLTATVLIVAANLDAQRRAERRLLVADLDRKRTESLYKTIAEISNDVILRTDLSGKRLYVSPSIATALAWDPDVFLKTRWETVVHPKDIDMFRALRANRKIGYTFSNVPLRHQRGDGTYAWVEISGRLHRPEGGDTMEWMCALRDIDQRKRNEEHIQQMAVTDGLTGLGNRAYLDAEMARMCKDVSEPCAVMMLDADAFKAYNDTFGHPAGDMVLRTIADVLRSCVPVQRTLLARYGGEEFCVVAQLPPAKATDIAENIRAAIVAKHIAHTAGPAGVVSISIGVHAVPAGMPRMPESMIVAADAALYQAKTAGRNRVVST